MISREELAYRARRIAETRHWAHVEMPALLRSVHAQRLERPPQALASLPDTGAMHRLETTVISAVKLLRPAVQVRDTCSLLSEAVRLFYGSHGFLPREARIHSLRWLALEEQNLAFFALDEQCADELGCYSIAVLPGNAQHQGCEVVALWGRRPDGWEAGEQYYL